MKNDLIRRQDVLHELEGCDYELKDWQRWKLKTMVRDIPSAEKAQLSGEGTTKDATSDLISRKKALDVIRTLQTYKLFEGDDMILVDKADLQTELMMLPSAEPERLTDDDFETIRIHLNAQKEKLCNQQRWKEAEEYQRIIDRFMAFASAEPEVIRCKDCKHWYKDADSGMSCEYTEMSQPEDGFCNWAERRGEEE